MNEIIDPGNTIEQREEMSSSVASIPSATPAQLLQIAVSQGADLAKLEKLMELQERYEKNESKKLFDAAFSAFKAEAVKVTKAKDTLSGPLIGRKYAELFDWVSAVTPALSKHGLSSSWKITKDEKDWIEVTCYLRHQSGHEEYVSMGGPPDDGSARNKIQARASTISYLERYTLKAITGLAEQDDDKDGNRDKAPKHKQKIHGERFTNALEAICQGQYTIEKLKEQFDLTEDQQTAVDDLKKELS